MSVIEFPTKPASKPERVYELPQPLYALWYEAGALLGVYAQSQLGSILLGHTKSFGGLDERSIAIIKQMAAKRGVTLFAA